MIRIIFMRVKYSGCYNGLKDSEISTGLVEAAKVFIYFVYKNHLIDISYEHYFWVNKKSNKNHLHYFFGHFLFKTSFAVPIFKFDQALSPSISNCLLTFSAEISQVQNTRFSHHIISRPTIHNSNIFFNLSSTCL